MIFLYREIILSMTIYKSKSIKKVFFHGLFINALLRIFPIIQPIFTKNYSATKGIPIVIINVIVFLKTQTVYRREPVMATFMRRFTVSLFL